MPADGDAGAKDGAGAEKMTDAEMVQDKSVLTTCGGDALAREALEVFNSALSSGKLDCSRKNFGEDTFVKVLKSVGIYGKLKGLLPTRSSVLPIKEVDFSGVPIFNEVPMDPTLSARWDVKRRAQTVQLAVQFVRVSTGAKKVIMEDCGLQGSTHDRSDLIEQEVIRLVKKFGFGSGKDARYTSEVSFAKNKFEDTFAKKLVEAAYWERVNHPDKENPPRLVLDLRGNKIRSPSRILSELRDEHSAGGPVSVASMDEPEEIRAKATVLVYFGEPCDRSPSPARPVQRPPPVAAPPPRRAPTPSPRARSASKSPPRRRRRRTAAGRDRSKSAATKNNGSRSRSRDASGGRDGGGRDGGRGGGKAKRGRRGDRDRKGGGGARRRRPRAARSPSDYDEDSYSESPSGQGGGGRGRARGGRARRGGGNGAAGGKRRRRRTARRKERPPTESYSDSRDDYSA